jgi:hypothetical protein
MLPPDPCRRLESNTIKWKEDAMARFRTLAAGAIFLFGTTFLWFMPSFLGTGTTANGTIWLVIQLLVLATVVGYGGAAWGLYRATAWWRPLAIGGSVVGTLVLVLWWLTVSSMSGVTNMAANMAANLALHAIGIAVLLAVVTRSLGRGLDRRLTGHPRQET